MFKSTQYIFNLKLYHIIFINLIIVELLEHNTIIFNYKHDHLN